MWTRPEQLRGFVGLVGHPWVRGAAEAVLGTDYRMAPARSQESVVPHRVVARESTGAGPV
ncbi:hypothetical protein ACIQM3_08990 [Streptomyces sp. NPDC091271]|uniref:hypothetical protein n=1 Tax=Streptomyces sp. NPDC091271 TaxID=3365980 RepID=UPI00381A5034